MLTGALKRFYRLCLLRFQISPAWCERKTFYPFSSVDEKHLMRFQSETSVFKFLRRSVDGASFHVVVLQSTAKKCTKIYNARAQLLFCSLNLLFGDIPLPSPSPLLCVRSLISHGRAQLTREI